MMVLARFGPKLPQLAEAALMRQREEPETPQRPRKMRAVGYILTGSVLTLLVLWGLRLL